MVERDDISSFRKRPDFRIIGLLSLGHLCVDTNSGAVSAILPFIKAAQGLSYSAVGLLVLVTNATSSLTQPLFGYLADRHARRWMLPLSLCLAGGGMGLVGFAGSYRAVMFLLVVMGLGVAAYHPEGYRAAAGSSGDRLATGLSWFSVGGNIGIALGPPLITYLVVTYGMGGSIGMVVPCLVIALLLLHVRARLGEPVARRRSGEAAATAASRPGAMMLLILLVTIRSWTHLGFATYMPFYYIDYLGAGPQEVALLLFIFLGAGAVGTVIGGPLTDRWGARRFIIWAFVFSAPLAMLFLKTDGIPAYVFLALFGAVSVATFTTTVVLGQAYLPRNPGMASGLIVGLAIGAGGLAVMLLGRIADAYGVLTVLWIAAALPVIGLAVAALLPRPH